MAENTVSVRAKLKELLIKKGLSEEEAHHISSSAEFLGNITDETLETDRRDISVLAAAYVSLVNRHRVAEPTPAPVIQKEEEDTYSSLEMIYPREKEKTESDFIRRLRGLPTWLRYTSVYAICFLLGVSAAAVLTLAVTLGVALVAAMICITVAGVALFIAGLLYGVSQLGSFRSAGLYEIGLGLILGGVSVLLVILFYNLLTVLLPFLRKTLFKIIIKTMKTTATAIRDNQ